jgi:hypothetical protein
MLFLTLSLRLVSSFDRRSSSIEIDLNISGGAMAAKSRPIPSPMQIYADQWAAWRTSALAAAVELDVFTAIDEGKRTADAVASRAGANASTIRRLLDVLVAMKYLARGGEQYELSPAARTFLSRRSDLFMEGIDQVAKMLSTSWQQLAQAVRDGHPAVQGGASRGEFFAMLVKSIFPQSYAAGKIAARGMAPRRASESGTSSISAAAPRHGRFQLPRISRARA